MKYCFDTNVLIQAWNWYYSPDFCADYWDCIEMLIDTEQVFIPEEVYKEIAKKDDKLFQWVRGKKARFVHEITPSVEVNLQKIYSYPENLRLVDSVKNRSMADPWVIAHAMTENAIVVTKELKEVSGKRVKIPNVCDKMRVSYISDFEFLRRVGIKFRARIES